MAKQGVTVKLSDKGLKSFRDLFGRKTAYLKVGVFGDKGNAQAANGSITVAELAAIHEFGLGVPERSFLRSYFDANEALLTSAIVRLTKSLIDQVLKNKKPATVQQQSNVLNKLGLFIVGGIQARISAGEITPPLAESTIARKGSSTPLIDTGQLRSSISHEVVIK
jgi:hypothetical protein